MCSNDTLNESIQQLARIVEVNSVEQRQTREELVTLRAAMDTWRATRCEDHHAQLSVLSRRVSEIEKMVWQAIAKASGATGIVVLILQWLSDGGLERIIKAVQR